MDEGRQRPTRNSPLKMLVPVLQGLRQQQLLPIPAMTGMTVVARTGEYLMYPFLMLMMLMRNEISVCNLLYYYVPYGMRTKLSVDVI